MTGPRGRTRWGMVLACLVSTLPSGCAKPPRWTAPDRPRPIDVRVLFDTENPIGVRHMHPSQVPAVPRPTHFRPCCAFGSNLRVRLGYLKIPGFDIMNILDPDELGHHYYDNGLVQTGATFDDDGQVKTERNGLVYTCRGGFIDTAHVRNWLDWTTFLATTIARNLEAGTVIELPSKGGAITIRVRPTDPAKIERFGRLRATIPLAQWIAYQASVWDEITTWFGWSHLAVFSERASSFSPEDLYSNVIGMKLMTAIVAQGAARNENLYNDSVDAWLRKTLRYLGAVDQEVAREAARGVEGLWWNSRRTVTDMSLVQRRYLDVTMPLFPWLVPPARMPDALREACGDHPEPIPVAIFDWDRDGLPLAERASLEIEVGTKIAAQEPFRSMASRRITQRDFPAILAFIRTDARSRFGPRVGRPD